MTRALLFATAALALGACAAPEPAPQRSVGFEQTLDPSCYTVDLFQEVRIAEPNGDLPEGWNGYKGRWGGGAWAGEWCHDLYVLAVEPDGLVRLIETHAPYEPWGKRATAYRRTARIGEDGRLRLRYGRVEIEYWLEDGRLLGERREDGERHRIMMTRRSV
mgnify:CR=1 FL=1